MDSPVTSTPWSSSATDIVKVVNEAYSAKARDEINEQYSYQVAKAFGYTPEQLLSIPVESNMGLSCGNPIATASIRSGEVVVDLGSGGGIDVFLAAPKAGQTGQIIGIDMSSDMVDKARDNARKRDLHPPQVSFIQANLVEPLPLHANSVDVVISNCVINLLPDEGKAALLREVGRILKPGGRVSISDILAKKVLSDEIKNDMAAYIGCISGAIEVAHYESMLRDAGLMDVTFVDTKSDLNVYWTTPTNSCCGNGSTSPGDNPIIKFDPNEWAGSYRIFALKPPNMQTPSPLDSPLLRWWDAFPKVKSTPPLLSRQDVAVLVRNAKAGSDYAIIDVRRADYEGGHIIDSYNWHAQTFYNDLAKFHEVFGKVSPLVFYCGSSSGRGPRCAGWYNDFRADLGLKPTAHVLAGGIKDWKADDDLADLLVN